MAVSIGFGGDCEAFSGSGLTVCAGAAALADGAPGRVFLFGDCMEAFVDSSRTCSSIFEVFGVTVVFVRPFCDSGLEGMEDAVDVVGKVLSIAGSGFADSAMLISGTVDVGVFALRILVVVLFVDVDFDFVGLTGAGAAISPSKASETIFLGRPLFFATTSADIVID